MVTVATTTPLNGMLIVRLESDWLRVDVAPNVGGRVVSLLDKISGHEFLWHNRNLRLQKLSPGSEYDPSFFGGIDELLPNDMPEVIDGVSCPDHGELWTTALEWKCEGERLKLWGKLPFCGLSYEREMQLRADGTWLDCTYRITNQTEQVRHFFVETTCRPGYSPGRPG